MAKLHLVRQWGYINALCPLSLPDGRNYTRVLLAGGEEFTDSRKVKSMARALTRVFGTDWLEVRRKAAAVVGRSHELPLGLDSELVLLPVWLRHPRDKDAGAGGYVALDKVADCQALPDGPARSRVVFGDGSSLETLNTLATLRNRLHEAALVRPARPEPPARPATGAARGGGSGGDFEPNPLKEEVPAGLYLVSVGGPNLMVARPTTLVLDGGAADRRTAGRVYPNLAGRSRA